VRADQQPGPEVLERLDDVTAALAALTTLLTSEEDLGRVLQRSVEQVTQALPGADMASVTVIRGDTAETVASTSQQVWTIDQEQYDAGDGPCLEAARTRQIVRTGTAEAEERWPRFTHSAEAAGVSSYLSSPLFIDEEFAGSLNLYSEQPHGFADFDVALLRLYVTAASAAIAGARRQAEARELAEQLAQAMSSRAVIDQAIGVLIAQRQVTAREAFQELSRQSQNTNVKVRDIAAGLLEDVQRPGH
jgi:GAF domain-containing protein